MVSFMRIPSFPPTHSETFFDLRGHPVLPKRSDFPVKAFNQTHSSRPLHPRYLLEKRDTPSNSLVPTGRDTFLYFPVLQQSLWAKQGHRSNSPVGGVCPAPTDFVRTAGENLPSAPQGEGRVCAKSPGSLHSRAFHIESNVGTVQPTEAEPGLWSR